MAARQGKRHRQALAVRETGVSRHQGGPMEGPPETHRTSQHYHNEGIKGVHGFLSVVGRGRAMT